MEKTMNRKDVRHLKAVGRFDVPIKEVFKFNHYINVTSQFAVKVKYNLDKNKQP